MAVHYVVIDCNTALNTNNTTTPTTPLNNNTNHSTPSKYNTHNNKHGVFNWSLGTACSPPFTFNWSLLITLCITILCIAGYVYYSSQLKSTTMAVPYRTLLNTINKMKATMSLSSSSSSSSTSSPFDAFKSRYHNVLTLDPQPDCKNGRYIDFFRSDGLGPSLTLTTSAPTKQGFYLIMDGFGSFLSHYMFYLTVAMLTNTTMIDFPIYHGGITHAQDESKEDREAFLQLSRFHVNRTLFYNRCGEKSHVRRHTVDISFMMQEYATSTNLVLIDQYYPYNSSSENHSAMKVYDYTQLPPLQLTDAVSKELNDQIELSISSHDGENEDEDDYLSKDPVYISGSINKKTNTGYTLFFDQTNSFNQNDVRLAAQVMEIRYKTFHRYHHHQQKSPQQHRNSHYFQQVPMNRMVLEHEGRFSLSYQDFSSPPDADSILVAIHIRRNDIIHYEYNTTLARREQYTAPQNLFYLINDDAFIQMIGECHGKAPETLRPRMHYTIYSEGDMSDFFYLRNELWNRFHIIVNVRLNGATTKMMQHLIQSDVLIMSTSSFSYAASTFHHDQIKINADGYLKPLFSNIPNLIETRITRDVLSSTQMNASWIKLDQVKMSWKLVGVNEYRSLLSTRFLIK